MDQDRIRAYYASKIEKDRLNLDHFRLEGIRTKEIIGRFLGKENLKIIDIGGGAGFYAFWLQLSGHHVSLVDLSPENVALAHDLAEKHGVALDYCSVGNATDLSFPDNAFDLALLMGPLYHLTQRDERVKALREVNRVLKPGGIVLAAIISRYASLIDGLRRDLIADERFEKMLMEDLRSGIHRNETDNPEYFTTAFFHTPEAIRNEVAESGLKPEGLIAVEGVGMLVDNLFVKLKEEPYRLGFRKILNTVESNEALIALSPHIIAVARKA